MGKICFEKFVFKLVTKRNNDKSIFLKYICLFYFYIILLSVILIKNKSTRYNYNHKYLISRYYFLDSSKKYDENIKISSLPPPPLTHTLF